jgi:transcriptional regulator with XRE-family HTH domain
MIPETLKDWKELNGLTIQQMAERLKLSYSYVGWLLRGRYKPSRKLAERISAETGIPVEGLLWPERFAKKEIKDEKKLD